MWLSLGKQSALRRHQINDGAPSFLNRPRARICPGGRVVKGCLALERIDGTERGLNIKKRRRSRGKPQSNGCIYRQAETSLSYHIPQIRGKGGLLIAAHVIPRRCVGPSSRDNGNKTSVSKFTTIPYGASNCVVRHKNCNLL